MNIRFVYRSLIAIFLLITLFSQTACRSTDSAAIGDANIIKPEALAHVLRDSTAPRPHLIHVGFAALYNANHIPGSVYAGPGAREAGIEKLKSAVSALPKDADIVIYCGCCPWGNCPNVRPAFAALGTAGYTKVRVLSIEENMDKDWIEKGYPVE